MKGFLDIAKFSSCSFDSNEWREWEKTAKSLPDLIKNGTIRKVVEGLPKINLDGLNENEIKRAYTVLTFIAHSYIRGNENDKVIKVRRIHS
jgi:formylmethanofuran:tetrahydromethanopterin formyltransferase